MPMDVQAAINNTNVWYVELDMLFRGLRSCLMHSTRVFIVLVVAGFITRVPREFFTERIVMEKGDEDVKL